MIHQKAQTKALAFVVLGFMLTLSIISSFNSIAKVANQFRCWDTSIDEEIQDEQLQRKSTAASDGKNISISYDTEDPIPCNNNNNFTHKITTSKTSGRRFLAMVTTYTGSQERRATFYQAWKKVWPELTIVPEYSFKNHKSLQGYALLSANVLGMQKAIDFSESTNQDFDYFIILEDDAIAFDNTTWPTASNSNWNDLDQMLDELEANKGGALWLGCHGVYSYDRKDLVRNNGNINASIATILHAFGSYAWMISREHLPQLQQRYAKALESKTGDLGTTDNEGHFFFMEHNISEYAAVPLLVDHQTGYSLNRQAIRHSSWEGHRDWWNFKDTINAPKGHRKMDQFGEIKI